MSNPSNGYYLLRENETSSVGDRPLQLQIPAARADRDASLACGDLPALRDDVPVREVVARELKGHRLRLPGLKEDGVETLQVLRRLFRGSRWGGVELRDLRAGLRASVGERERNSHDWVVEPVGHLVRLALVCQTLPTYQGSSEEPGPRLWREPPAVDPLIFRLE